MADLVHHAAIAGTQFTDAVEVVVLELAHLGLLGKEGLQALLLLLVQIQLLELLLQSLQVSPERGGESRMFVVIFRIIYCCFNL